MFEIGNAVVHPKYGAGVVVGFIELKWDGHIKQYYDIELASESSSNLLVPIETAVEIGLRPNISKSRLEKVWRVLRDNPNDLPNDHKERHGLMEEKLQAGSLLGIAEAVRDMAWRQQGERRLTGQGRRIYKRGMLLLAAEVATAQGTDLSEAEEQIQTRLQRSFAPEMAV